MLKLFRTWRARQAANRMGQKASRALVGRVDAYLDLREPVLGVKLLKVFQVRLLTIHAELSTTPKELAQAELGIFRDQLRTYSEGLLDELRLRLQEAEALGVREAVERHIRDRAAVEVRRLTRKARKMAALASAAPAK